MVKMTLCSTRTFPLPPLMLRQRASSYRVRTGMTAAAVLAPGRRPFAIGKPTKSTDINIFYVSSGHLDKRLSRETAQQHGV